MNPSSPKQRSGRGRFAVGRAPGLGTGIALVGACIIVTSDPLHGRDVVRPTDAIRLDPVVVTISNERFDAIRGEEVHAATRGPLEPP